MKIAILLVICLFCIALFRGFLRGTVVTRESERYRLERQAYLARQAAERDRKESAKIEEVVERFFPFVKAAWAAAADRGDPRERLRRVLAETEGITLGTSDIGFPAVLPESARRRHLTCYGKSGYGKSSLGIRLTNHDFETGRGTCTIGSEAELFRDWVLPLIPIDRAKQTIYFKPSDPRCPLSWNPLQLEEGEDQGLAAGELFAILKRAIGETSIGSRADSILSSALAVLVGRPGATLLTLVRFLQDEVFRSAVVAEIQDPYLREFWTRTFPQYPAGAVLPILTRLMQFLRLPQVRAALCHPVSSFSIGNCMDTDGNLCVELSGLDPDMVKVLSQTILSKIQLIGRRREKIREEDRKPVHFYLDEFHEFGITSEETWRELLSRGRRYGLGLHLFTQHPNQLPRSLQHEILGNVSSLIVLNLSGTDAATVRRELLIPSADGSLKPIPAEEVVSLQIGEGFARLGSGACSLRVKFAEPIAKPDPRRGDTVRRISWETFAAPPVPFLPEPVPSVSSGGANVSTTTEGSPAAGRGGERHRVLQGLAKRQGEAHGFRANLEEEVLGGAGRIDVSLFREDGMRVAVEVVVSNAAAEQIAASITKAIAASYTFVLVLRAEDDAPRIDEETILGRLDPKDRARVRFVGPEGLQAFLGGLPIPAGATGSVLGYRLKTEIESVSPSSLAARRRTLSRLIGGALLRQRWPS